MQLDQTTQKLIRLLALERKRVKDLSQKVQEGKQKASDPRLRALLREMKERLPAVDELRATLEASETRLRDFEALKEALFKGQETHAKLRTEIRELKEKLNDARAYGEKMQKKLIARDKGDSAADERYLKKMLQARILQKHGLALRYLLDQFKTPPEQVEAMERLLGRRVKQATELQIRLEQSEKERTQALATAQELSLKAEWAEEKLNSLQQQLSHLEEQAIRYRDLETQYKQMSDVVNRLRSLGDI
jgi:chromosome segregation ATPase